MMKNYDEVRKALADYKIAKEHIFCRFASKNYEPLSAHLVQEKRLGLSVIFCMFLNREDTESHTLIKVTHDLLDLWKVSEGEMIRNAYENTNQHYRYIMRNLLDVTRLFGIKVNSYPKDFFKKMEALPQAFSDDPEWMMYTIVNQDIFNTSAILLCPDQLAALADQLNSDLVILPSSVNELICVRYRDGMDFFELHESVLSANRTCVAPEEFLSNDLYLYRRSENHVEQIEESLYVDRRAFECRVSIQPGAGGLGDFVRKMAGADEEATHQYVAVRLDDLAKLNLLLIKEEIRNRDEGENKKKNTCDGKKNQGRENENDKERDTQTGGTGKDAPEKAGGANEDGAEKGVNRGYKNAAGAGWDARAGGVTGGTQVAGEECAEKGGDDGCAERMSGDDGENCEDRGSDSGEYL